MRRLVQRVESEPAPGVLDRGLRLPERSPAVGGPIEERPELARERPGAERLPGVEGRAVAEPETREEAGRGGAPPPPRARRARRSPRAGALPRRRARRPPDRARPSRGRRPPSGRRERRAGSRASGAAPPGRAPRRSRARAGRRANRGCACLLRSPGRRGARWPCGCRPQAACRPPRPPRCRGTGVADPPAGS